MCGSDSGGDSGGSSSGSSSSADGPGYGASTAGDGYGSDAGYGQSAGAPSGSGLGFPAMSAADAMAAGQAGFGGLGGGAANDTGGGGGNSFLSWLSRQAANLGVGAITQGLTGPVGFAARSGLMALANAAMSGGLGTSTSADGSGNSTDGTAGKGPAASTGSSIGELLRGGYGLYQANRLQQLGGPSPVNNMANANLRGMLASGNVSGMPGYQAGLDAVSRQMAATGFNGSGNMATALMNYGNTFYNQNLQQYANLSQLGTQNQGLYNIAAAQLGGQAMNTLGYGAVGLFGK